MYQVSIDVQMKLPNTHHTVPAYVHVYKCLVVKVFIPGRVLGIPRYLHYHFPGNEKDRFPEKMA